MTTFSAHAADVATGCATVAELVTGELRWLPRSQIVAPPPVARPLGRRGDVRVTVERGLGSVEKARLTGHANLKPARTVHIGSGRQFTGPKLPSQAASIASESAAAESCGCASASRLAMRTSTGSHWEPTPP